MAFPGSREHQPLTSAMTKEGLHEQTPISRQGGDIHTP